MALLHEDRFVQQRWRTCARAAPSLIGRLLGVNWSFTSCVGPLSGCFCLASGTSSGRSWAASWGIVRASDDSCNNAPSRVYAGPKSAPSGHTRRPLRSPAGIPPPPPNPDRASSSRHSSCENSLAIKCPRTLGGAGEMLRWPPAARQCSRLRLRRNIVWLRSW